MKKVLFVCLMNMCRSRTGEDLYKHSRHLKVRSAGTDEGAVVPVTPKMVEWADTVYCFEEYQRDHLRKMCKSNKSKVVCLYIPDRFPRGDRILVELITMRLEKDLGKVVYHDNREDFFSQSYRYLLPSESKA
jgi:predicted protein tyrosine phosphatase